MSEIENLRHAEARGKMLQILAEDYNSRMTSVQTLSSALDLRGFSLTTESLAFHLNYLADSGYVKLWRTEDMPGFRADRTSSGRRDDIRFARIMPRGIQLVDGEIDADPKVKF